ncbi:hypothetical protein GTQ34_14320 [Muricauda sp. JGD-17]|uniref:Glycosyl transferase family 1 domain-containing protein n=1 Tax=Flagellimonas ochracea TaxID=2696472 RepID=A0A964TE05_9FLAO|nr:glycosyltransferase family 4 protein [Allomuricauda ochracea]NAY93092.1 hypothetical protein [Allomuricauda ochracea]
MQITALHIVGPHKGVSGYDHHVRSFVGEFLKLGIDIHLKDVATWSEKQLPDALQPNWIDSLNDDVGCDVYLYFCMPHQFEIQKEGRHVLFTMFEADRIPAMWLEPSLKSDLLIVPTQSSRASWEFRGFPKNRIRLCPLGVDSELFVQNWPPLNIGDTEGRPLSDYSFRFLNISELRPRKNLLKLIRVWMEATTAEDDAILILKIGGLQEGYYETFKADLEYMQNSLGIERGHYAPIHFIQEILSSESMVRLYRTTNHYISMSHGEGWDMPMMEAGAAGLTLIAPHHTAYTTYLNDEIAHLIPSRKVPVEFDGQLGIEDLSLFEDAHWWEPDAEAAKSIVRAILDGTSKKITSPRSLFLEKYSWKNAANRFLEILSSESAI